MEKSTYTSWPNDTLSGLGWLEQVPRRRDTRGAAAWVCKILLETYYRALTLYYVFKGDVTGDDSQRRFLAQHSVRMLEQCCNHEKQCRSNAATLHCAKNCGGELSPVTGDTSGSLLCIYLMCSHARAAADFVQK